MASAPETTRPPCSPIECTGECGGCENKTTQRIPISAAQRVADQFGLKQCLLIGWDGENVHVVTYGKTKADCEAAAKAQEFWAGHIREFSFKGEAP